MLRRCHGLTSRYAAFTAPLTLRPFLTNARFSTQSDPPHNVAVLGGGITGLACAYYLTRDFPRAQVTIYEASDRIGGWLLSNRVPVKDGTVLFEAGPRTLRPLSNGVLAAQLMQELDLAKDAIFPQRTSPAARNRYVYYPDHLVRMPHPSFGFSENLWSMWTEPVFETAILSGFGEMFKRPRDASVEDESVGDFFSRRFSKTMVDRILSAVLHGIYAGDAYQLSAKSLFPSQWRDEESTGSVLGGMIRSRADGVEMTKREAEFLREMRDFSWDPLLKATLKDTTVFTFKDGMGMLIDRLVRHLVGHGNVEFKTGTSVEAVAPADEYDGVTVKVKGSEHVHWYTHAISALSPWHLNQVCTGVLEEGQSKPLSLIAHIPTVTVMTVNLYFRTPNLNPAGFGYVIPQATPFENNPERALGVVFDTAYSPSPSDLDTKNWHVSNADQLRQARETGQLVNVNDFGWYNLPNPPNAQDQVKERGTKLTVMLGGHWWDDWPAYPDEQEGLALARSVVRRHLGITEEPEAWQVNLQKDCIPQYTVGHADRLEKAHFDIADAYEGRLRVAGNWIAGVGVNDCLRTAREVVRGLEDDEDRTGLEHVVNDTWVRVKPLARGEKDPT